METCSFMISAPLADATGGGGKRRKCGLKSASYSGWSSAAAIVIIIVGVVLLGSAFRVTVDVPTKPTSDVPDPFRKSSGPILCAAQRRLPPPNDVVGQR